ncbi:MAG: phosphate transporter, inner rane subunit PstC [Pelosinus sp.]|jgi:phosphate transport system permease protein|nr:phosphate transporter, inner rane subunit PstC [Pelosinus sp.]
MQLVSREHKTKLLYDFYMKYVFIASAGFMTLIILTIIVFVGGQGLMTFKEVSPFDFFFTAKWDPMGMEYGALSFIMGSLAVTVLSILLGAPLGLAGAIFMAKIAPPWLSKIMRPATDLYVAIPSVVYGFVGLTIIVPFIRNYFHVNMGFGLLAASIILAVMILPTIVSISEDALRAVPQSLEEASLALGATRWQTIWNVLLPSALPGILTSIILAMARAVGETMAVQMVIGNTPQLATSLFMPTSTLPSEIVVEMGNTPFGSAWGNALFLMAFVLLVLSLLMILIIRRIARKKVA